MAVRRIESLLPVVVSIPSLPLLQNTTHTNFIWHLQNCDLLSRLDSQNQISGQNLRTFSILSKRKETTTQGIFSLHHSSRYTHWIHMKFSPELANTMQNYVIVKIKLADEDIFRFSIQKRICSMMNVCVSDHISFKHNYHLFTIIFHIILNVLLFLRHWSTVCVLFTE